MPTVLVIGSYYFRFYSTDESEPPHIHVVQGRYRAKFWLDPVHLADPGRFKQHELKVIEKLIEQHEPYFLEQWDEYFGE